MIATSLCGVGSGVCLSFVAALWLLQGNAVHRWLWRSVFVARCRREVDALAARDNGRRAAV